MLATTLFAIAGSILFGSIEIFYVSKTRRLYPSLKLAMYIAVLTLANVTASLLAFTSYVGRASLPPSLPPMMVGFLSAVAGVSGFTVVLRNVNVSFMGKGVLALDAWIKKARDIAEADAVMQEATATHARVARLAAELSQHPDLNTFVLNVLGTGKVQSLEQAARKEGADEKLYKAFAIASKDPDRCAALVGNKTVALAPRAQG